MKLRDCERGFTLVELMVVIVIIGLMSAMVVLTMADPRGRIASDADSFAGHVRAARDSAIVSGRSIALWVSQTGYGFERRVDGKWSPIADGPLAAKDWTGETIARIGAEGRARIIFDSVGRADRPLAMTLMRKDRRVVVRMDLNGRVTNGK